jgi:DNA repair exonuclease SbcCD nuclease subunit
MQSKNKKEIRKNKHKKPFLILCADLHLRNDIPVCRVDDYQEAQWKKFDFLLSLATEKECAILCAGDLFDSAISSKSLEIKLINILSNFDFYFFVIPGNHDLPGHNIKNINKSSIGILQSTEHIDLGVAELEDVYDFSLNREMDCSIFDGKKVGVVHGLIHKDDPVQVEGKIISTKAIKVLKNNPKFDLIVSGDNHKTFVQEYQGRLLVNPGSMMRMKADQVEHKPSVFLYYDDNTVEQVFFPIEKNVITREHLDKKKKDDKRKNDFIKRVKKGKKILLDFEENIKNHLKLNKTKKNIKERVFDILDKSKGV